MLPHRSEGTGEKGRGETGTEGEKIYTGCEGNQAMWGVEVTKVAME